MIRFVFLLLLLCPLASAQITEIMADPMGNDNNQEYVELALTNVTNISMLSFVIADLASNDTAQLITTLDHNTTHAYALFVEEGFNVSMIQTNTTCHVFSVGSTIGNNLGNTNDTVSIYFSNTTVNASYELYGCAAGEGCSLTKHNGSWLATPPTPCTKSVFSNESQMPACIFNFSIAAPELVNAGSTIEYSPIIHPIPDNISITYWFEDLHARTIKSASETKNLNAKRYTPKPEGEQDYVYKIKMRAEISCNETILENETLVVVKGDAQPALRECSTASSQESSSSFTLKNDFLIENEPPLLALTAPLEQHINESLNITTTLYNPGFAKTTFRVHAYVYRNSVNYTPRDAFEDMSIPAQSQEAIRFSLLPDIKEPGEYSLKVQAYKEGRKTPYEERTTIQFLAPKQVKNHTEKHVETKPEPQNVSTAPITKNTVTGSVVQSRSDRIMKNGAWVSILLAAGLYGVARLRR